tara:strand:+ start:599 stop:1336 length:738 start_codon:yes stop_codon:yes gene_type:complete
MSVKKTKVWSFGNFYSKDNTFLKKGKIAWNYLFKLIQNKKNKKIIFWDIGCAEGALLKFIEHKFPKWSYFGSENNWKLINSARKNTNKSKIFFDDVLKKYKKSKKKGDIIFAGGLHPIFDNLELFLNRTIERCEKSGEIFLHGAFNPNNIDMIIRMRDCTKKNFLKNKINVIGWNRFSEKTARIILKKNPRVKKFKFITINFPKSLKVKKTIPFRGVTKIINNRVYFVNEMNIIEDSKLLHIKLK